MPTQNQIWKSVAAGAVGGLVASFAMNEFQAAWSKASQAIAPPKEEKELQEGSEQDDDATVKTAKAISSTIFDHDLTDSEKKWAGPVVHYGFGTVMGAAYGALADTVPVTAFGYGIGYGTGVWFIADELVVPQLGLSGSAIEAPLSSHVYALASHLVYGVVTHLVRRLVLHQTR